MRKSSTPPANASPDTTLGKSLHQVNPLIAYEKWDEDTAANVRGALSFIASAIEGGIEINQEEREGVGRLILCCVAAMEVTA